MMASLAMAFHYGLGIREAARRIELAIWDCIHQGECTPDIGGTLTTTEVGEAVRTHLGEYYVPMMAHG